MLYTVDPEFLSMYKSVEGILFDNYSKVASKSNITNLESDLDSIAYEAYKEAFRKSRTADDSSDQDSDLTQINEKVEQVKNDDDFTVFKFIVLSALSSYYSLSHLNDLTGAVEGDDLDKFGYDGSLNNLKKLCRLTSKSESEFETGALQRLLASQRACSCKEYFDNKKYLIDVRRIKRLIEHHINKPILDDNLKEAIISEFSDIMGSEVDIITEVYQNVLAAAFGLDKYVGVFNFSNTNPVIGLTKSYNYKDNVQPSVSLRKYAALLKHQVNIVTPYDGSGYTDRQFESNVIYNNFNKDADKPTYFPHKTLELISLGSWTSTKAHAYKACTAGESRNLNTYIKYLRDNFELDLLNYIAYCCNADYAKLSQDIKDKYTVDQVIYDIDCPINTKFKDNIMDKIKYYTRCVTLLFVVTELDTESKKVAGVKKEDILSFRIKVAYSGSLIDNTKFCAELGNILFKNPTKFSDAENNQVQFVQECISLVDYAYTFNADKVYSRPIFAYKALEAIAEQGMQLDWKNILLGKYADGSLCRSASGEKIVLQDVKLHNIYAGSRSGKGVMCFNLFATAIASKIPLFYVDRKPDTAVILKALGSGMFAVNGGQYSSEIDLEKQFVPSNVNFKIPSYLSAAFADDTVKHDYIYFRAMLLIFCLVIFMDKTENKSHPLYKKIADPLSSGAVFVFDEFTNFVEKFLSKVPTTQNWFKECYSTSGINEWKKILTDVNAANIDLDAKRNAEKQNESQIAKAEGKLETAVDNAKTFSIDQVYFSELAEDYRAVVTTIPELFRAGGSFVKQAQIFIIGQEIPLNYYDGDTFFTSSNGQSRKKFNSSTHKAGDSAQPNIPMIKMLNNMAGDYILGYQPPGIGKPSYLAQTNKNMISSSMLTASRRCFCYYNPSKALDYNGALQLTDTAKAFKDNEVSMKKFLGEFVYFKPFLILNNGVKPPDELLYPDPSNPDVTDVSDELENMRKGSAGFTQYAQSQYVGQCLTSCNRAGLTWNDLLNGNEDPNDPTNINDAVGFEGYIRKMGGGAVPVDALNASGDVMTVFVNEIFGYKEGSWLDFLADFRPEALFKPQDFINAIDKPELTTVQARLSGTFFCPALTKESGDMSFAKVFAEDLGTLLNYYSGAEDASDSGYSTSDISKDAFTDDEDDGDDIIIDDDTISDDDTSQSYFDDDDDDISFDDDDDDDNILDDDSTDDDLFDISNQDYFDDTDDDEDDSIIIDTINNELNNNAAWNCIWDSIDEDEFIDDLKQMYPEKITKAIVVKEMQTIIYEEVYDLARKIFNQKISTSSGVAKRNILMKFNNVEVFARQMAKKVSGVDLG